MTRGFGKRKFTAEEPEESNKRRNLNEDNGVGPAVPEAQNSTILRSEPSRDGQNMALGYLGRIPTSRSEARHFSNLIRQQEHQKGSSGYADTGSIDRGRLLHEDTRASAVQEPRAAPPILPSQPVADASSSRDVHKRITRPSNKRTRDTASSYSDVEDELQDTVSNSQRSTRRSKRARVSSTYDDDASDDGDERKRKISKLNAKIAAGKGPQKGSLGPTGEVRIREDGRMEFRDVNNPEWTLAAYHNDYRRQFLDEAAEDGEFDHTPTRGEADNDETSFEPEQQSWGPERADWQNIVNSEGIKVMFEVDKPKIRHPPQEPANWIHDGLVLLDNKNHPVKDWPGLNKTLSSAIESWRWEALVRMYPWLTVADLLARMPHTRKHKGKVLPLQTPQAFTNRTYRFRVPNQIPASNMKNGSATYKAQILRNLAEQSASTTEGLSVLNPDQVEKVRKVNKGKFKQNSRYLAKKDEGTINPPPPSRKRKAHDDDDDTESEPEQAVPEAKKICTHAQRSVELKAPIVGDQTPGYLYNDTNGNAYMDDGGVYSAPTETHQLWEDQKEEASPTETIGPWVEQNAGYLVPLFATLEDQGLALLMDETFTNPSAVILARRTGNEYTGEIGVYWYRLDTPRYVFEDGFIVGDVAHEAFSLSFEAQEPIPSNTHSISQFNSTNNVAPPLTQIGMPPSFGPLFDEPSNGVYSDLPAQIFNDLPATPVTGLHAPSYDIFPDILAQTSNDPPGIPVTGLFAPSQSDYPNPVAQAPTDPPVTPVTSLAAPLPFTNQIGEQQTESDTSEED